VWDVEEGRLYWVDSTGRRFGKPAIWSLDPKSGAVRNWQLDQDVGAMAMRRGGGAVLALNDGFYTFDFSDGAVALIAKVDDDPTRVRLNDGKCDRRGRFFAGGMDDREELAISSLWRLDPDLTLTKVGAHILCSNGPCWSPDNKVFYFADTFTKEIRAYDYDINSGRISNQRTFTSLVNERGFADGATVDAEGFYWCAHVISGDLVRYAPDGSVDRRIGMPVVNITSVMFGGDDLTDIYVTSMARVQHISKHDHFAVEAKPQFGAGSLFRIRGLGIEGLPEVRFAG